MIFGGHGDDHIEGGSAGGNDWLYGDEGNDHIEGGDGNDIIGGRWGADVLLGQQGHDSVDGGPGYDDLYGGVGDDELLDMWSDFDMAFGGGGEDLVWAHQFVDVIAELENAIYE